MNSGVVCVPRSGASMVNNRISLLILLCLLLAAFAFAESEEGEILSVTGAVFIDTFGTGDFIAAYEGDVLYRNSILRTERDGVSTLDLNGREFSVAPSSEVKIEQFLTSNQRKRRFKWLSSLVGVFKSVIDSASGKEEEVVLGGRAAEAPSENNEATWFEEEDDDELAFGLAQEYIEEASYLDALVELQSIVDPFPGIFLPGELRFWEGYSHYHLENFGEALHSYTDALDEIASAFIETEILPFYQTLMFQAGSASYLVGEEISAIGYFEVFLSDDPAEEYVPPAYLMLIHALQITGDSRRADNHMKKALTLLKGTSYEQDLKALAENS